MVSRPQRTLLAVAVALAAIVALLFFQLDGASGSKSTLAPGTAAEGCGDDLEAPELASERVAAPRVSGTESIEAPKAVPIVVEPATAIAAASPVFDHAASDGIAGWLTVSGAPVAGWAVVLCSCPELSAMDRRTTDAMGAFLFDHAAGGTYALVVEGPATAEASHFPSPSARPLRRSVVEHRSGERTEVVIELADPLRGTSIDGRVVDQLGNGCEGIPIRLASVSPQSEIDPSMWSDALARPRHRGAPLGGVPREDEKLFEPCAADAEFVSIETRTDASGGFRFEGLPPDIYVVSIMDFGPRTIEYGESMSEPLFHGTEWTSVVNTTVAAHWPIGDLEIRRKVRYDVVVRVVDSDGNEVDGAKAKPPVWVLTRSLTGGYGGAAVLGGRTFSNRVDDPYGFEGDFSTCTVVAQIRGEDVVSESFDVYDLEEVDGVRVAEITLRLP